MALTFESGLDSLMHFVGLKGEEAYHANAADPLHAAFRAKAAVHAGPMGMPMIWALARGKLNSLSNRKREGKALAYIHVPFCQTRCLYCMFYQNAYTDELADRYTDLLIKEMQLWADRPVQQEGDVCALYLGGGTPSALSAANLSRILKAARTYLPLAADCEITLEGRMHDMTSERLDAAVIGGVNRVSLGVQTFNDEIRLSMQRLDNKEEIFKRLELLSQYPQIATVIDLIYGFPMQTESVWENDVRTAAALPLDGVDCYQLNLFQKSPLAKRIEAEKMPPAATLAQAADQFAASDAILSADPNWERISNTHWRRTAKEHNIYNSLGKGACDCLAFGCGAGGKLFGHAFMQERHLAAWEKQVLRGEKPVFALMKPTANWHLLRTVACAVENGPFNLKEIGAAFGKDVDGAAASLLNQWIGAGLLEKSQDTYCPTVAGMFWHVTMAQFLVNVISKRLRAET